MKINSFLRNPNKTFVHFEIDEGTGIFLTRNNNTYSHGYMAIRNNLSYRNGASGIVCHFTDRAVIEHNTVYLNGQNNGGLPGGIGVNTADDVTIINNITWAKPDKWALGVLAQPVTNLVVESNLVWNSNGSQDVHRQIATGWVEIGPGLTNPDNADFTLQLNSPAVGIGSTMATATEDYHGTLRDQSPDIGAIEIAGSTVLPVIWLAFDLENTSTEAIILKWTTNVSRDAAYFVPEHSLNGINWEPIGRLPARYSASGKVDYAFEHTPPTSSQRHYYRIKEFDQDGSSYYSPLRKISLGHSSQPVLQAYPMPFRHAVLITSDQRLDIESVANVYDRAGQLLHAFPVGELKPEQTTFELDTSWWPPGIYWLVVEGNVLPLIKQ